MQLGHNLHKGFFFAVGRQSFLKDANCFNRRFSHHGRRIMKIHEHLVRQFSDMFIHRHRAKGFEKFRKPLANRRLQKCLVGLVDEAFHFSQKSGVFPFLHAGGNLLEQTDIE